MAAEEGADIAYKTVTKVDFHWEHIGADWHLLIYLALAIALAWWARRRYGPRPPGPIGVVASACRIGAILLLVAMIAGPSWRTTDITPIPGRVLVAIDRSASMDRADREDGRARLTAAGDLHGILAPLAKERGLLLDWQSLGGIRGGIGEELWAANGLKASGASSPLAEELITLIDASTYDLVVLVSDGRVTTGVPLTTAADRLRARDLPCYVLTVGGMTVEPALWIDQVVVNPAAALGEREPVLVRIAGRELSQEPITVRLLVDGEVVSTGEATRSTNGDGLVELSAQLGVEFHKDGESTLRVEVAQGGLEATRDLHLTVSERKLAVLVLDSRPRYELRYLREALRRDHTIELHAYLGDGKRWRRWTEKGPDKQLPLTEAELRAYDVIILGDVGPDQFMEDQLRAIDDAVRRQGTGLIWLPGETGATSGFLKHRLGELIPTRLPGSDLVQRGFLDQTQHRVSRSPAAEALHLFDPGDIPWESLPPLLGAAPLGEPRAGAEILMHDQDDHPLVVTRAYPPGRSVILAVDDTWRWRRNVGDAYLQRFHGQLLRFAASGRRQGDKVWRLGGRPKRVILGETLHLGLAPVGPVPEQTPERVSVAMIGPTGEEIVVTLPSVPGGGGFEASLPAPGPGTWRLRIVDGPDAATVEAGEIEVSPPGAEWRDPRADATSLATLARTTGGMSTFDAAELVAELPDLRQDRVEVLPPHGLWDTPWALSVLILLLSIEWSLRRWHRLP